MTANESDTADDGAEKYEDVDASPVKCPECGEYVALMWRSPDKFRAGHAGFTVRCECAMGPRLDDGTVGGFWGPWYPDEMSDSMREVYEQAYRDAARGE